jgi:hypothetical protein
MPVTCTVVGMNSSAKMSGLFPASVLTNGMEQDFTGYSQAFVADIVLVNHEVMSSAHCFQPSRLNGDLLLLDHVLLFLYGCHIPGADVAGWHGVHDSSDVGSSSGTISRIRSL